MRIFWDIESYTNLFCAAFIDEHDILEMYYIVNSEADEAEVLRACRDSGYNFTSYDLKKDVSRFRWHFEQRIPKQKSETQSLLSSFLGLEDVEIKPKENWYIGYNTLGYDIQMIDYLLKSTFGDRVQTTTETLREYSDTLINDTARRINTKMYEQYANQVDAAFQNETMVERGRPTIGLKTLVGVKGGSIIESESNKTGYSKDIYFDVLYNINDVKELKDVVWPDKMEKTFDIRRSLLDRFPKLRENGITVNSTSAKFVEYIVSPDKKIDDYPTVSYLYPAKHIADKLGVPQTDVLEDTKNWYMERVFNVVKENNPQAALAHLAKFMSIYSYYDSFRGKNWNDSGSHFIEHGITPEPKANRRALLDDWGTFLPFIDKYGNDSGTYANFSAGGIHGAEIFKEQLEQDRAKIAELRNEYKYISAIPKGKISAKLKNLITAQSRTQYSGYPQHLSHEIPRLYKLTQEVDEILDPKEFTPFMYDKTKGTEVLIDRYKYTSTGFSVHQDFAGYYPMLLINLGAFYDGNGRDNYADVYNFRISVKKKLKDYKFGSQEWIDTNIEQEGYKLILNSASGVLDGSFDTNLRANNKALSMRIIGQLFTWLIGQALALEGASVPSSNTDGIYVFDIDEELNKQIVDTELKRLYVAIDPEPVFLVSKDANNRLEAEVHANGEMEIVSARGGTLTSWQGARVDNRLSHPALVDKVMTKYLLNENIVDKPVNKDLIRKALKEYQTEVDARKFITMASWVMRSTSGSIFIDSENNIHPGTIRTWLTNDGLKLDRYGTRTARRSKGLTEHSTKMFNDSKLGDPDVISYLTDINAIDKYFESGITVGQYKEMPEGESFKHVTKMKISNLAETANVTINNNSIIEMSDEQVNEIYEHISEDEYVDLIASFAEVWHNQLKD